MDPSGHEILTYRDQYFVNGFCPVMVVFLLGEHQPVLCLAQQSHLCIRSFPGGACWFRVTQLTTWATGSTKCLSQCYANRWTNSNNRSFQNDLSIPPAEGLRHCQPVGCYGIFWVPTGNSFSKGSGSRLFAYLTLPWFRNLLIQICKKAWGRD